MMGANGSTKMKRQPDLGKFLASANRQQTVLSYRVQIYTLYDKVQIE